MNPDMNGGGSAWSPEGESGVGNPFKSVDNAQVNPVSQETPAVDTNLVDNSSIPVSEVPVQSTESIVSPEKVNVKEAAMKVVSNIVGNAKEKFLNASFWDSMVRGKEQKVDRSAYRAAAFGGTLALGHAALFGSVALRGAEVLSRLPENNSLLDGFLTLGRAVIENPVRPGWDMQAVVPAYLAAFAGVVGTTMLGSMLVMARKEKLASENLSADMSSN